MGQGLYRVVYEAWKMFEKYDWEAKWAERKRAGAQTHNVVMDGL